MTWPWVAHLRDGVVDKGDPYTIAWTLWWDYHQTFTDPLHLFDANVFYPFKLTLAFTENIYGIAVFYFPLFALGLRPLTVHSIATFLAFPFAGYGAFRLARTLTGSVAIAIVAGIVFAFVPFRYTLLAHLHYLYTGWIPLLLEALILFARDRTWKRASWLGVTFFMNGLSCLTWFIYCLPVLLFLLPFILTQYPVARDRNFWIRGVVAGGIAGLLLVPFILPYYYVSTNYHLVFPPSTFFQDAPPLSDWLIAEGRSTVWRGLGKGMPGKSPLFPGLLPPLLGLLAIVWWLRSRLPAGAPPIFRRKWVTGLDILIALSLIYAVLAAGFGFGAEAPSLAGQLFTTTGYDWAWLTFLCSVVIRICLAWEVERDECLGIGALLLVVGVLLSMGVNGFLTRILREHVVLFENLRIPERASAIAYLGLALLAARAVAYLRTFALVHLPKMPAFVAVVVVSGLLLFELRATPMKLQAGALYPDELTMNLKTRTMKGGLLELPVDRGECRCEHYYTLEAADHEKPLINSTASFISPISDQLERITKASPFEPGLMELVEEIPASYVTVHNDFIRAEKRPDYDRFLTDGVRSGRLRHIGRYGASDLYAVVKTEPDAQPDEGDVSPF